MNREEVVCCIDTPCVYTSTNRAKKVRQIVWIASCCIQFIVFCVSFGLLNERFRVSVYGDTFLADIKAVWIALALSAVLHVHMAFSENRCAEMELWMKDAVFEFGQQEPGHNAELKLAQVKQIIFDLKRYHSWSMFLLFIVLLFLLVLVCAETVPNHTVAIGCTGAIFVFVLFNLMFASMLFISVHMGITSFRIYNKVEADHLYVYGSESRVYNVGTMSRRILIDDLVTFSLVLLEFACVSGAGYYLSSAGVL